MSPIDPEIKDILDDHEDKLEVIDDEINQLKSNYAVTEKRLTNIEQGMSRIESSFMQGNTLLLQGQQTLVTEFSKISTLILQTQLEEKKDKNDTELNITKNENKSKIIDRLLIVVGSIAGYFLGKSQ